MKVINTIFISIRFLLSQPLSILRFSLSILIGKQVYEDLDFIYEITDNANYTLSKTWFTGALPEGFFVFDSEHLHLFHSVILIATIGAALGLLGRFNLFILALLSFYVFGVNEGIGIFNHHMSLPSQVILALAFVPGSMKLSIDVLILRFYNFVNKKPWNLPKESPKWGFNLILALVALTYFTAGISKLRYGHGVNWLDGNTLGFYLKEKSDLYKKGDIQIIIGDSNIKEEDKWKDKFGFIGHTYGNYQTSPKFIAISEYITSKQTLLVLLSIGSVLFELLAFVVFINSKYRNMYLISAIIFHLSIGALMGISFRLYRLICFCLIDWLLILNYVESKLKRFKLLNVKNL